MRDLRELAFVGGTVDRAQELRADAEAQAHLRVAGRVLPIWRGRLLFSQDGLGWVASDHPVLQGAAGRVFLGRDGETGLFAADISHWTPPEPPAQDQGLFDLGNQTHPALPETMAFGELRQRLLALSPAEAERAAMAKALTDWHRSHRFCSACGTLSEPAAAGWHRRCPACGATHFPRTDPVVIMLVTRGNSTLLGRGPGWPEGMYSCLAGFMEPGETVEAAVRREVAEETAVRCGAVRYLASQPWPFPASLMIGCHAVAETEDIVLDPVELEDALWVTREEMVAVMAGEHPAIRAPRKGAIARSLIANWLADRLD
jgi:NAD+ diphosphatase